MNSKTPWTSGPWTHDKTRGAIVSKSGVDVLLSPTFSTWTPNMELAALAPELIEALRALVGWADLHRDSLAYESGRQDIESARALLAKLEGGQP